MCVKELALPEGAGAFRPPKRSQSKLGLQPRNFPINGSSIYCRSMTRNIKRQKQYAAREKRVFAYQDRDIACNPVSPRSEIAVREDNPGPYVGLLGKRLRVSYYSRRDGLNVIWIVYPTRSTEKLPTTHIFACSLK